MTTGDMIRELRRLEEVHRDDFVGTGEPNWSLMCRDVANRLEELLKAQEPIAPVKVNRYMETDENGDWFSPETYDCGNCGVELHGKANYCHLCGRAVKRE